MQKAVALCNNFIKRYWLSELRRGKSSTSELNLSYKHKWKICNPPQRGSSRSIYKIIQKCNIKIYNGTIKIRILVSIMKEHHVTTGVISRAWQPFATREYWLINKTHLPFNKLLQRYYKVWRIYYKGRQVLQSMTDLLQRATVHTSQGWI